MSARQGMRDWWKRNRRKVEHVATAGYTSRPRGDAPAAAPVDPVPGPAPTPAEGTAAGAPEQGGGLRRAYPAGRRWKDVLLTLATPGVPGAVPALGHALGPADDERGIGIGEHVQRHASNIGRGLTRAISGRGAARRAETEEMRRRQQFRERNDVEDPAAEAAVEPPVDAAVEHGSRDRVPAAVTDPETRERMGAEYGDADRRALDANRSVDGRPPIKFDTEGFKAPKPGGQSPAVGLRRVQEQTDQRLHDEGGRATLPDGRTIIQTPDGVRVTFQPGEVEQMEKRLVDGWVEFASQGGAGNIDRNPHTNRELKSYIDQRMAAEVQRRARDTDQAAQDTGIMPRGDFAPTARARADVEAWQRGHDQAAEGGMPVGRFRGLRGGDFVASNVARPEDRTARFETEGQQMGHARGHAVRGGGEAEATANRERHDANLERMTGTRDTRSALGLGPRQRVREFEAARTRETEGLRMEGLARARMDADVDIAQVQAMGGAMAANQPKPHWDAETGMLTVLGPDGTPMAQHDLRNGPFARDPVIAGILAEQRRMGARADKGGAVRKQQERLQRQMIERLMELEQEMAGAGAGG